MLIGALAALNRRDSSSAGDFVVAKLRAPIVFKVAERARKRTERPTIEASCIGYRWLWDSVGDRIAEKNLNSYAKDTVSSIRKVPVKIYTREETRSLKGTQPHFITKLDSARRLRIQEHLR
ncbi:hypothetical protein HN011_002831 [Eciton burchellii]|nr:hypothetical protein HN011_002831 [Eciton burchellii]